MKFNLLFWKTKRLFIYLMQFYFMCNTKEIDENSEKNVKIVFTFSTSLFRWFAVPLLFSFHLVHPAKFLNPELTRRTYILMSLNCSSHMYLMYLFVKPQLPSAYHALYNHCEEELKRKGYDI